MRLRILFFLSFTIACLVIVSSVHAQTLPLKDTVKKVQRTAPKIKPPKPITHEFSVGGRLNTDGWSLFADRGRAFGDEEKLLDKFYSTKLMQLEFGEHKNPKEIRTTNGQLSSSRGDKAKPYIYGKINNFYALKLGYGRRKMIAGKQDPGNVSIHWVYLGGLSFGLLKPYYIDAYVKDVKQSVKYSDDIKDDFLNPNNIVGSSGWSKGLNEIQVVPGLHAKTALHFDFAANARTLIALEAGVGAELYVKKIEIMAEQKNSPLFFNAFVSLQFGKRW